jgi:SAM-dependent methyltransferase
MMNYTGERIIPWNLGVGAHIAQPHIVRYAWALSQVYGKYVVDLGCGCGCGTYLLSWFASQVAGVDIDAEAILFAQRYFKSDNLHFQAADVTKTQMSADIYVAFELLEHLTEPEIVLQRHRPLLWSMPVDDTSQFHVRGYTVREIDELTGGGRWFQSRNGMIVERDVAWFEPLSVLGVTR